MERSPIPNLKELKTWDISQLQELSEEIRQKIISVCLKNGGHIGASLGTVELTIALHRIFSSPQDAIFWDVGHQAYAHKILTGRYERFDTLRQTKGLSGFLSREESEHDVFGAGHSSTSISAMLGYAYKNPNWSVAVIGDGGLTAGLAFEALNNVLDVELGPSLIVLNDNQMSISENIGGIDQILSQGDAAEYFGLFGIEYVGPIDGHDLSLLLGTLNGIHKRPSGKPILLHVLTQKGRGYAPAEDHPALFHGVGPAQPAKEKTEAPSEKNSAQTWSDAFVEELIRLAENDPKILAITAAMAEGTGLHAFAKKFPDRVFDVGIAEAHAVTFAGGLAARGWKPVVAIYSTFLQRAFDSIIHDIALQKLPVVFAVDRAGLVGADGPTHHGAFDLAYTKMIPGVNIFAPEDKEDLNEALASALASGIPSFIRYPRGNVRSKKPLALRSGAKNLAISIGTVGIKVSEALATVSEEKRNLWDEVHLVQVKPFDLALFKKLNQRNLKKVYIFEEGSILGGIGESLSHLLNCPDVQLFGYPDRFIAHGSLGNLEDEVGLSLKKLTELFNE